MQQPPTPLQDVSGARPVTRSRGRIDGVDLARGLAIIGMVMVHVAPPIGADGGWYSLVSYGQASTLFALVAGIGIELSSQRGPVREHRARLVWRAAWLLPVGLLLSLLGTPVAVILQYYALWFLLAAPVLRWSTRALGTLTGVGLLVGPSILVWAQVTHPEWYQPRAGSIAGRGAWLGEFGDVLLTGYYPTVSWIWVVLAGMLLARADLRSDRTAALAVLGGGTVAATTYGLAAWARESVDLGRWQPWLETVGHSDTPPEMVATIGVATAVTGLCVLLARRLRPLLWPGIALGRLALSVYVGHIVAYAMLRPWFFNTTVAGGLETTLWVAAIGSLFAVLWLAVRPRGPLEALDRGGYQQLVLPLVRSTEQHRT